MLKKEEIRNHISVREVNDFYTANIFLVLTELVWKSRYIVY